MNIKQRVSTAIILSVFATLGANEIELSIKNAKFKNKNFKGDVSASLIVKNESNRTDSKVLLDKLFKAIVVKEISDYNCSDSYDMFKRSKKLHNKTLKELEKVFSKIKYKIKEFSFQEINTY